MKTNQLRNTTKIRWTSGVLLTGALLILSFQNCSNKMSFDSKNVAQSQPALCVSTGCEGTEPGPPLTQKPAVTTILIALGDQTKNELVVNGASAQLIAETIIRYTSPKSQPKILFVHDRNSGGEDPEDTSYAARVLLGRYDLTYLDEPAAGLSDADLAGYDVIWFNNPGNPMGSSVSRDTLIRFKGGVVMQGDDLSRGGNFDLEELTGLKYIENGTSVRCGDNFYEHNDNSGEKFRVSLDPDKIPGADASTVEFRYGNDIDKTTAIRPDLEIMATAKGGPESCTETRPAIVRYLKAEIPL